jgi:CheY-like chemotaxis protein
MSQVTASSSAQRPILHIEDDADAVFLTHRVFQQAGVSHPIDVVNNGRSALEYLTARIRPGGSDLLPLLILIDLDLPGKNGFEILEWIARQPALKDVMGVVLSASLDPKNVNRAFALGAAGYLAKYPSVAEVSALYLAAQSPEKAKKAALS